MLFIGGSRAARSAAIRQVLDANGWPHLVPVTPAGWPFRRYIFPEVQPAVEGVVRARDLHEGFPAAQRPGTRLITAQSTYQMQRWLDWLEQRPHVWLIADADRDALRRAAPEAFARRGPWADVDIRELPGGAETTLDLPGSDELTGAFNQPDPEYRHAVCARAAADSPRNAALHLAHASACLELERIEEAHGALELAYELETTWEAVHYEIGKFWLRREDTARAAASFAEAARLMPTFAAALSNLGAALGELNRHEEALVALRRALLHDPEGFAVLNNIGVVAREMGRLDDAEAAFRKATRVAPYFIAGHYNLAHVLVLQERFGEAREAVAALDALAEVPGIDRAALDRVREAARRFNL